MNITLYQVDAFTDKVFGGNPAAVCIMPEWLPDEALHQIAKENNLPVTSFIVIENNIYHIRWVTPEYEIDICGHGTLAAGYVIFNFIDQSLKKVVLHSRKNNFTVIRDNAYITLNFPVKKIAPCTLPILAQGLGCIPKATYQHQNERCIAIFDTEEEVKNIKPNMQILQKLEHRGISITAPGVEVDFVSRTFYPKKSMSEDPATGASHCLLVPYWSSSLNKHKFHARQVSTRGGEMFCHYQDDRVYISGTAVLYMQGTIFYDI